MLKLMVGLLLCTLFTADLWAGDLEDMFGGMRRRYRAVKVFNIAWQLYQMRSPLADAVWAFGEVIEMSPYLTPAERKRAMELADEFVASLDRTPKLRTPGVVTVAPLPK